MKHPLTVLLAVFCFSHPVFSQEVSKTDPTYFKIDYRRISEVIEWKGEEFRDIYFADSVSTPQLLLKVRSNNYKRIGKKSFTPFVLDTTNHKAGYYAFTAHPDWFHWLKHADAITMNEPVTVVGQLKKEFSINQASVKELFRLLIEFGVINTYIHLFAELVITATSEDANNIEVAYSCVYHYCTTKCFDPGYKFKLRFDKQTKEIMLVK